MCQILLICFLIAGFPVTGFEQSSLYVTQYYPAVNRAELAIVRSDYAAALREYQTAFAAAQGGFARDYHNAALCALYLKNEALVFGYFEKLALKGLPETYFTDTLFRALQDSLLGRYSQAGTG